MVVVVLNGHSMLSEIEVAVMSYQVLSYRELKGTLGWHGLSHPPHHFSYLTRAQASF